VTDHEPPLYDVDNALQLLARHRRRNDPLTRQTVLIADKLATHMARHFTPEQADTAGRALVIAAGSVGILAQSTKDPMAQVNANIIAHAGHRLVLDAEAARHG
jgi:hypothetical protein